MELKEKIRALKKLKRNFIKYDEDIGLCHISSRSMYILDPKLCVGEFIFIDNLLIKSKKRRKVFYFYDGEKTERSNLHFWKPKNRQARINWIDREIKKLKK